MLGKILRLLLILLLIVTGGYHLFISNDLKLAMLFLILAKLELMQMDIDKAIATGLHILV